MDVYNLLPVSNAIRRKHPEAEIIICADNDQYGEFNTGIAKAKEAALTINAKVVIPEFKDTSSRPTDFNDLYNLEGEDTVREILLNKQQSFKSELFFTTEDGLFYKRNEKSDPLKVCNYFKIIAVAKNDEENRTRIAEFKDDDGYIQNILVKPEMAMKNCEPLRILLLRRGFYTEWTNKTMSLFALYISCATSDRKMMLIHKTGIYKTVYLRPGIIIGQTSHDVLLDPSISDTSLCTKGILDGWRSKISMYCMNNSRLILAVSCAFASVLLEITGTESGGFHLIGLSSAGKTWRLLFLSSGEVDLCTHVKEIGRETKARQEIRFLSVPAMHEDKNHDIFEHLHGFERGDLFSNYFKKQTSKYYGTPSIAFIEKVMEDTDSVREFHKEYMRMLQENNPPANCCGQDLRAFERFALVAIGGELATKYGITGWNTGDAIDASMTCFNDWLTRKGGVGNKEEHKISDNVRNCIERYGGSRFKSLDYPENDIKITTLSGYKENEYGEMMYYFWPQ